MSRRELERVEVMGRVGSGDVLLQDAAAMLGLSYRQTKPGVAAVSGTQGERTEARQRGAGVESEQAGQIAAAGAEAGSQEIFGAEGEPSGRRWRPSAWRKKMPLGSIMRPCGAGCWQRGCGADAGSGSSIVSDESASRILGNWCSWTEVFMTGWRRRARAVA